MSLGDWGTIIQIILGVGGALVSIGGGVYAFFRHFAKNITEPLSATIKEIRDELRESNRHSEMRHEEQKHVTELVVERIDKHDIELSNHNMRLKYLENKNGLGNLSNGDEWSTALLSSVFILHKFLN